MSVLFAGGGTPGGQVVGATDARGYTAVERILSPENFAVDRLHQARHRPRQDPLHAPGPARPPGQRPDADPRADGLTRRGRASAAVHDLARRLRRVARLAIARPRAGRRHRPAKPPTLDTSSRAGGRRGETVEVTAAGSFGHWPVRGLDRRARASRSPPRPEKGKLSIAVAPDAPAGVHWVRLFDDEGATALRPFLVGTLPEVVEAEPNDDPARPQRLDDAGRHGQRQARPQTATSTASRSRSGRARRSSPRSRRTAGSARRWTASSRSSRPTGSCSPRTTTTPTATR